MRFFLILVISLLSASNSSAQIGTFQWRLHVPANNALDVLALPDRVYAALENGVVEYDLTSAEISMWDITNGLSDNQISCLAYLSGTLYIAYENGNLDLIKSNSVFNIPAIKLAEVQGDKKIYKMVVNGSYLYLATGFGIVKIDPVKREVRDTYYPTAGNDPVLDIAFRNDSVFALAKDRLYTGILSNPALADPAQWTVDSRVPVTTVDSYAAIERVEDEIYLVEKIDGYGSDTLYRLATSSLEVAVSESFAMEIMDVQDVNGRIGVNYYDGTLIYNSNFSLYFYMNSYTFTTASAQPRKVAYLDGRYWIADAYSGLVEFFAEGNNRKIPVIGPPGNRFYQMDWLDGRLLIASGGLSSVANTFNNLGVYLFEDETWEKKDDLNVSAWQAGDIFDYLSTSINPQNTDQFAVSTYSLVPLSIFQSDGSVTTYTSTNSPLELSSLGNGWSLVSDLKYDENGNLWLLNGYTEKPLRVLTSAGEWQSFDLGFSAKNKFTRKLVIDYEGNKWLAVKGVGLYGFNDKGTPTNVSDDDVLLLNTGTNSGALPSIEVNALAVDFDNEIWIGTDNGFAILYNAEGAFDAGPGDYNAQRIKLEFEGNVEYMLGATKINDIEVDGANRKWFATENSGIILLSADGSTIIEQHTSQNSPLPSDNVIDIKMNHQNGELFIITDKGLISYRTDATYEDPEYENVTVFPNPVRPEFSGPITIQGIRYDSDVKITDIAGNLVYQTTSNGGTATWNGKTLQGDKAATGVYLIWTAPNNSKGRYVGKVLLVR